ncbi:hypothetical protein FZI85_06170 [Mycobacterium sp. CBMA293]|uniref:hypothetical protein n=1 Tax=unclassified Mycolicibacterium TaxID=2636767 RepID=UPI0012DEAA10|nr:MULTISPECIES: hypothetical protein [unclassified Mycolicibacterium]MUL45157.1 hypothetical protein [Mycolicibacterium sp. CBMA 360]MUL56675.1 hypothetical protein [Mycolicibacterium sp. CBMA 335]MUL69714.1 hypothetical protein [Mycolicibacterium sp. CBMA 311]MUL91762.1 hypothetical protein [Mycolicibacterium sp. CBMA 230]MUM05501.1 hypothetical protein [Mycolicibacterium sp. CBMA 213]
MAAAVWAVAAVVAIIFGIPTLLTIAGIHVDAGLIVNSLAAMGAFSAAAVALWVATSDRRERQSQSDAADEAQAKLISVSSGVHHARDGLDILVRNVGERPIVDVEFVSLTISGHSLQLRPRIDKFSIVEKDAQFQFEPTGTDDPLAIALQSPEPFLRPGRPEPTIVQDSVFTATVQFCDLNGNVWQRSAQNHANDTREPHILGPVVRIR